MSARKLVKIVYRALQLAFVGLVIAHSLLDLGYPWWWNFLPIALSFVILVVAHRWGGTPDSPAPPGSRSRSTRRSPAAGRR